MKQPVATIGRYDLFDELASGGQASVHLGRLTGPAGFIRAVAIKRVRADRAQDEYARKMMLDEARLASRVQHPNVVQTLDVVWHEGELVLVMELIQGESLARLMRACAEKGGVPVPVTVSIIAGALHGLHAAHQAVDADGHELHLVHRDLSPQNIIVDLHGLPKVLDFGVAKARGRAQDETNDGVVKGKPSYLAPEQIHGETDRRSDVWAMGVVLWEALAGQKLFTGKSDREVLGKVLSTPIASLRELGRPVSEGLDAVVQRALDRDPKRRFPTAEAMAEALEALEPASSRQVARWVVETAGAAIEHTRQRVRELESLTGPSVPEVEPISIETPVEGVATRPARPATMPSPPPAPPEKPKSWLGVVLAGLTMLSFTVTIAVLRRPADEGPRPPVAVGGGAAVDPAAGGPATVEVTGGGRVEPAAGGGEAAPLDVEARVANVAGGVVTNAGGGRPQVKRCVGPKCKKPLDCTVPYTMVKGVKQWRPECF